MRTPPKAGRAGPVPAARRPAPRAGTVTPPRRSRKVCSIGMAHGRRSESDLHFDGPHAAWAGLPPPRSHGTKRPLSFTCLGNLLNTYRVQTWRGALGTRGLADGWADALLQGRVACRWRSQPCGHRAGGAGRDGNVPGGGSRLREGTGSCHVTSEMSTYGSDICCFLETVRPWGS